MIHFTFFPCIENCENNTWMDTVSEKRGRENTFHNSRAVKVQGVERWFVHTPRI